MSRILNASQKKPAKMALVLALVFHAALISVQTRNRIDTGFVRGWILDGLAPFERLADRGIYGVRYVVGRYFWFVGLYDENERLKRENDGLRIQLIEQNEAVLEAERVRALADLQKAGLGKSVIARIIGGDPGQSQTVTIDKGTVHGVKPDSAVVTSKGIAGRVIHSSNFFSIVQLILDAQSAVGVMVQSTRRQGILKGNGRALELDYIDDDNDLKPGDVFLTSGDDRVYPKGYPVGVITSIGPRRGLFKTLQIQPSAELGRLEEVLCVVERPESVDIFDPAQGPPTP